MIHLLFAPVACLAFAAPQATESLSFETPKDWDRREDRKLKQITMVPPNLPKGKECGIVILGALEFTGTAQDYLDQLVQNVTRGNTLQGKVQFLDLGGFRVAVVLQTTPQGAPQYMAIHVARWEKKAQAAIYASNDAEVFKTYTEIAQAMFLKVAVPGAAKAGAAIAGLNIPLPPGWTQQADPSGWTIVTPPADLTFGNPRLYVATRKLEGSHWAAHRALLKSLIEEAKWPGSYQTAATPMPGPFIGSEVSCTADARVMRLFTAASGTDQMEVIVLSPVGRGELTTALLPILERTTLKNPPPAAKRPEVVEAYRRPKMKKYVNADGTFFYGSLKYERMVLLSNGVVDFSMAYAEGMGASRDLHKIDASTLNGFYGSWKAEGKTVRIRREAGKAEEVWEKENGSLRFGDQVWAPMPKIDGLRLKGRYAYKSDGTIKDLQFNYWIEFAEDGTFKTGGLLSWLAVADLTGRPKPPETATGTYEIRDWTIWFKVNGAVVWSTDITTMKDDPKDLETLLIHTYSFKRE